MPICPSVLKLDASRFGHPASDLGDTLEDSSIALKAMLYEWGSGISGSGLWKIGGRPWDARAKAVRGQRYFVLKTNCSEAAKFGEKSGVCLHSRKPGQKW
jgi:hypothetical protein